MQKDAEETRKIAEEQLEEAVRRRREEREELEKQMEERRDGDAGPDTVEISEEGRVLLKNNIDGDGTDTDGIGPDETKTDAGREPVTYTKTGEAVSQEQSTNISVSV